MKFKTEELAITLTPKKTISEVNESLNESDYLYKTVRETIKKTLLATDVAFNVKMIISPVEMEETQKANLETSGQLEFEQKSQPDQTVEFHHIRPRELQQPEARTLLDELLVMYFRECNTYNVRPSMRIFCNYFCKRRYVLIKYSSMRNNSSFREIWQTSQKDCLSQKPNGSRRPC